MNTFSMTLAEFVELIGGGAEIKGAPSVRFSSVAFDSRTVKSNALFFAIPAARDGHDFVQDAFDRGAAAAVVERVLPVSIPQIVVPDARAALLSSARAWRSRFKIPVVAVAGSNGKTTTTQMVLSVVRARFEEGKWVGTEGNLNNDLGVAMMLWKLRPETEVGVFEVGMNHVGEMQPLVEAIAPTVGAVTNTQRDHQEFLASLEETARDNGQVFSQLGAGGIAVINRADPFADLWIKEAGERRIVTFGTPESDVFGVKSEKGFEIQMPTGRITVNLAVPGAHNEKNAVCAAAVSYAMGRDLGDIQKGLEDFRAVAHRGEVHKLADGTVFIDDSYNANPDSMIAALNMLAGCPGEKLFVMADMGELGVKSVELHREVGRCAKQAGIGRMFALGNRTMDACDAFGEGAAHFESADELKAAIRAEIAAGPRTVLFKGSNFMRLFKVAEDLLQEQRKEI
jgi:UDP-N-acetylmuramoyl-tripeptide--D-alanyl-D-alanine ligase